MSSVASVMVPLRDTLGIPSTKFPVCRATFVSYVLPPLLCYLIAAVLVITPGTRIVRVALWPLVALLALRTVLSVDLSRGKSNQTTLDFHLMLFLFSVTARTLDWALVKKPLERYLRPGSSSPSTIMDAFDLIFNFRGIGWEWSRGFPIPHEKRSANRLAFVFSTFFSVVIHALMCGAFQRTCLILAPIGGGPVPNSSTIFDETLPSPVRYLRSTIITYIAGIMTCTSLRLAYDVLTLFSVLVLGQDPVQWPPMFDSPWRSTSLNDFWSRRWHQWFRHIFLFVGGYPFSFVLGRDGVVIGGFLASALLHYLELTALPGQAVPWLMLVGFGMMGPGILAERVLYRSTGKRVGGTVGWFWTMGWLLFWGNFIVEGFARAGVFGCSDFADSSLPVRIPVEPFVTGFDAWLHTI